MPDNNAIFNFSRSEKESINQLVKSGVLTKEKAELLVGLTRSALAILAREGVSDLREKEQDIIANAVLKKIHDIHKAFGNWKTITVAVTLHGRLIRLVFDPLRLQQPEKTRH
jgi:2,3-bisphosphoglycerate-independent phosphoglycerate mutase